MSEMRDPGFPNRSGFDDVAGGHQRKIPKKPPVPKKPTVGAQRSASEQGEENGSSKYLMVFFFYIQDAGLFRMYLPEERGDENFAEKILRFSHYFLAPSVDLTNKAEKLCFSPMTGISKASLKAVFGICVILLIFLMYAVYYCCTQRCQRCCACCADCCTDYCAQLKDKFPAHLLKGFLCSSMFIGCVWTGEFHSVFVQGDVHCTGGLFGASVFVVSVIIVTVLLLNFFALRVERQEMTVWEFIGASLFPPYAVFLFLLCLFGRSCCSCCSNNEKY